MSVLDYASALKALTALTETKNLVLAKITGYDVSYISKWLNGSKLPATKYIEGVNEKLGTYFAEAAEQEGKEEELHTLLSLEAEREDLPFAVNQWLCAAYRASMKTGRNRQKEGAVSSVKVMTGTHDSLMFMQMLFRQKLSHVTADSNILILDDFCALADIGFWNCFETAPQDVPHVTVHVGVDLDKLAAQPRYMNQLYRLLDKKLNYDFRLYNAAHIAPANAIIMEREFVIQYSFQSRSSIGICTYIPDPVLVEDIYNRFFISFTNQPALLAPAKALGISDIGFRTAFYSASQFFFFLTNGFDFLLPQQAMDDFLQSISASRQQARQIGHLRIMWDELLSTGHVEFLLPTTSIIRYIETGNMFFTDAPYRMKAEDRKLHLKNILQTMHKNPLITMGVFQPSAEMNEYHESNLSFYSNYSSAFLKKNPRYIHDGVSPIYIVSNKKLVDCFHAFFDKIKGLPTYRKFTYRDISEQYEKYKGLVERTIDLYETTE